MKDEDFRTLSLLASSLVVASGVGAYDWRLGVVTIGVLGMIAAIVGMIRARTGLNDR